MITGFILAQSQTPDIDDVEALQDLFSTAKPEDLNDPNVMSQILDRLGISTHDPTGAPTIREPANVVPQGDALRLSDEPAGSTSTSDRYQNPDQECFPLTGVEPSVCSELTEEQCEDLSEQCHTFCSGFLPFCTGWDIVPLLMLVATPVVISVVGWVFIKCCCEDWFWNHVPQCCGGTNGGSTAAAERFWGKVRCCRSGGRNHRVDKRCCCAKLLSGKCCWTTTRSETMAETVASCGDTIHDMTTMKHGQNRDSGTRLELQKSLSQSHTAEQPHSIFKETDDALARV